MGDELITPVVAGAALLGKLAYDVLGPSAKYLGKKGASWTEAAIDNTEVVLKEAYRCLQKTGKTNGTVPPRILKDVLQQSYFCEDETQAAYLGGILASSKSPISRDDRAISYLAILNSLSTYQIRTHAILYSGLLRVDDLSFQKAKKHILRGDVTIVLLEHEYLKGMEFTDAESSDVISQHTFVGLEQRGLSCQGQRVIRPRSNVSYSGPAVYQRELLKDAGEFRYFFPTALGIELFLWGVGCGDQGLEAYAPTLINGFTFPFRTVPIYVGYGQTMYG